MKKCLRRLLTITLCISFMQEIIFCNLVFATDNTIPTMCIDDSFNQLLNDGENSFSVVTTNSAVKSTPEQFVGTGVKVGSPVDLGEVVKAPLTVSSYIAKSSLGEYELYLGTNGDPINNPTKFYVLNSETGEVKFSQVIPGMSHLYGIVQGSDNNIYFAGTDDGILYRYLPDKKKIETIGKNPSNKWVWDLGASSDGKIYGATYPSCKVFEYDIVTNSFKDLGSPAKDGVDYARGIGVTDKYIYVGVGMPDGLMRIDRKTHEKTEITFPNTGVSDRMVADIWVYNGKLFIRDNAMKLFVLDENTGECINSTLSFQQVISPPSPYDSNIIYYKTNNSLMAYNMKTNKGQHVVNIPALPSSWTVHMNWIKLSKGQNAGRDVLVIMHEFTECMLYDPIDNTLTAVSLEVEPQGIQIQSIEKGPDGKLYIGGYQKGMSIYDINTNKIERNEAMFNQPEGIGFLNSKVYFGTYGGAVMYKYDPSKPYHFGYYSTDNPGLVYDIDNDQDRPFAITSGDNKLFVGTVPEYGILGGELTIYDEASDKWNEYSNVVQDQSIIGLTYKDGKLYGGTSIWGGLGIEPKATEAKIFVWDVATRKKVQEVAPVIPGIDEPAKMIGELSFGPDGLLWGVACGTIFAMKPDTLEVVKSKLIFASDYIENSTWRPNYIRWGEDGLLYTTVGRKLVVINPDTLAYDVLMSDIVSLMALGDDGNIYYANGSKLYELPVIRNTNKDDRCN